MSEISSRAAFNDAYASLNAAQKQAVDTVEGPVMVIAGPGTGKTQILTLRIANILRCTDARPENILALTFTEAGARAMRTRLRRLIGEAAYHVRIQTFHGFADYLIKQYPEAYARIIGGQAISELEKIELIESILLDTQFRILRPSGAPGYYVRKIISALQTLKQEYITPDDFAVAIDRQLAVLATEERYHEAGPHKGKERSVYTNQAKAVAKNQELLAMYRLYEAGIRERQRYDYEDMILETISALRESEAMRLALQETYLYVLADEHQDVNASQNQILQILTNYHEAPNIFVVGDEKQAIYRFQGASLEEFLYFGEALQGVTTIALTENYRSGQKVLDAAHDLVRTDDPTIAALRIPLTAVAVSDAKVMHYSFTTEATELATLVEWVSADIAAGLPPSEIAIIVRSNREVEDITVALRKAGVAVAPSADTDILTHPLMEMLLTLCQVVVRPGEASHWVTLLHAPYWGLSASDSLKILATISRQRPLPAILADSASLTAIGVEEIAAVERIPAVIEGARSQLATAAPHRIIEYLLLESGLMHHALGHDTALAIPILRRIYDEVEGMVRRGEATTLAGVVARLEQHRTHGITFTAPYIATTAEAVVVTTAHKAKGLEFASVYIPHLTDRAWGGKQRAPDFALPLARTHDVTAAVALDDERRLLYVAMTRAKTKLVMSYAASDADGKEQLPSRFLADISPAHCDLHTMERPATMADVTAPFAPVPAWRPDPALVIRMLTERGLSPTAYNNYLKSPWEFLYRNVLRVPGLMSPEQQFGTALHSVLQQLQQQYGRTEILPVRADVALLLTAALERLPLADTEYARLHERGLRALVGYYGEWVKTTTVAAQTEVTMRATLTTGLTEFPELMITGNIDRLDWQDGQVVGVTDYKSGKPKTRGQVLGTTKDSTGDYYRQLVFYALLLDRQADPAYRCSQYTISFVEPDTKGKYRNESFTITTDEITALEQEIIAAIKHMMSGDMFTEPCDPTQCHYCDLVALIAEK